MKTVNINKATAKELQQIIFVGPIRAELIIQNRPFRDVHELSKILGIGRISMIHIINQRIEIQF
jgi:competence ComEA-like helix-hairpin-helix protein